MNPSPISRYAVIHLAAAHTGVAAFRAARSRHEGSPWHAELAALTEEIEADRDRLEAIVRALGAGVDTLPYRVARSGLHGLGHLTRAFHWFGPVSKLYEVEKLRTAVRAKAVGWDALRVTAEHDDRLSVEELDDLVQRADRQSDRLRRLHLDLAASVLSGGSERWLT